MVILVGTSHPGNAGAAARGAANFGVEELRFVAPRCDVYGPEAQNRAVHAAGLLETARTFDTLGDALWGIGLSVGTTARASDAPDHFLRKPRDIREWVTGLEGWDGRLGLVFGREDSGLSRDEVNLLDDLVTVPTADYASLNLAHAVSLVCYELHRPDARSTAFERSLDDDALRSLTAAWDSLTDTVETRPWRQEVAKAVFRKILGRSLPDSHEVHNIIGIVTRALKRFDHPEWSTENSRRYLKAHGLLLGEEE